MNLTTTYLLHYAFVLFLLGLPIVSKADKIEIHDVPGKYYYNLHNDDFTVQISQTKGIWRDLYEYAVEVDMDTHSKASMVFFDFEGSVNIRVKVNNGLIQKANIRPKSLNIKPKIEGRYIYFSLDKPTKLSLEINDDKLHNLHLFANPIDYSRPKPTDPNVVYFGPGVHTPGDTVNQAFHILSNQKVYIDGSAILNGKLLIDKAKNVEISGRGIILGAPRGVEIRHSENISIEGLTFINPHHYTIYGGQVTGLIIQNIKAFSSEGWSDGIDLMSCSDVKIDGVFMRNSDDCIAIYAHRWDFYGNSRNLEIKNATL